MPEVVEKTAQVGGGVAPDLPGFGTSGKPDDFDYTMTGYDRWLEEFVNALGLDRLSLVVHDWGGFALQFAQRFPERIERLVIMNTVPLLPGYRWHWIARIWRRPVLGEMFTSTGERGVRSSASIALRPKRGSRRRGRDSASFAVPRWSHGASVTPTCRPSSAKVCRCARRRGGVRAGHWLWLDRPEVIDRVAGFLGENRAFGEDRT